MFFLIILAACSWIFKFAFCSQYLFYRGSIVPETKGLRAPSPAKTHTETHTSFHTLLSPHYSLVICITVGTGENEWEREGKGRRQSLSHNLIVLHDPFLLADWDLLTGGMCLSVRLSVYEGLVSVCRCVHAHRVGSLWQLQHMVCLTFWGWINQEFADSVPTASWEQTFSPFE